LVVKIFEISLVAGLYEQSASSVMITIERIAASRRKS
jgi:hypothetical protein